jgi:L-ascorbate metabolism protein UlaG (beta-lactamase superfamily)
MCLACLVAATAVLPRGPDAPFPEQDGPVPWPDGRLAGGRLTWTGVAGLVLEVEGARIAFDPFVTRPSLGRTLLRAPRPDPDLVARWFGGLAAVFVGHTHFDHALDLAAAAAASPAAAIHGSPVTVELCRRLGVAEARLVRATDGAAFDVGPFRVEAVGSAHGKVPVVGWLDRLDLPESGLPATPFRYPRGPVLAWRVTAGGRTFHVQGSAGIDDAALLRQEPADALLACLAARRGTPSYLARLGERLRPRVLVPLHHDDFFLPLSAPPRPIRTLRWAAFLEEAAALSSAHGTVLWCPPRCVEAAW